MSSTRISQKGVQTREQILGAAKQLFAERGYHQTSVYDLFGHAGITKGAFFHHWKSKEDLALSIFENLKLHFESEFFAVVETRGRTRDKIERILRRMSELTTTGDWAYGRLLAAWSMELTADEERIGPAVHALKLRWCALWKELIRNAQIERDLRSDISAENLSFLVVSAIFGVLLMSRTERCANSKTAYEILRRTLLT